MADPPRPDQDNEQEKEARDDEQTDAQTDLIETVGEKALRRLAAQRKGRHSLWYGLGAFGVIGWSIAIPTVIGAALGLWLDRTWPGPFSWTLALLLAGVCVGIFNAWYWMSEEQQEMETEKTQRMQDRRTIQDEAAQIQAQQRGEETTNE